MENNKLTSFNFNMTHSWAINENHSLELSGFYRSPTLAGRWKQEAMYMINIGVQKKFANGSSLRFNIRDMLNSMEMNGETNLPSQGFRTYGSYDFSNRTYSMSYSFNFGNAKLKGARSRTTGSEEERSRIN